jgi:manganese/zinc/iron transport system permease protein
VIDFFTNPVVRTSMLGTLCMALSSSLVGSIVFLKRRSLIGETLSHAAFPGILLSVFVLSLITSNLSQWLFVAMTLGGFLFSLLGLQCVHWMESRWKVKPDAALTFILATFMGWGVLLASALQKSHPVGYRQSLLYLYGQAATMTVDQALLYGSFSLILIVFLLFFYTRLKLIHFDSVFAHSLGLRYKALETATFLLIVIAIILGIRSVGVVLMAGMLIGPAAAARPWSRRFSTLLIISSGFGLMSALMGNILSYQFGALPTGPMILLSSSFLCIISLLIAPRSGLLVRLIRMQIFRFRCRLENGLKLVWKKPHLKAELPPFIRFSLYLKGWISKEGSLTPRGELAAQKIVRLHRLWEVYLVEYLGQNVEKVHRTAEELEHLFSPALEKELTRLLNNPAQDPHKQPIPPIGNS